MFELFRFCTKGVDQLQTTTYNGDAPKQLQLSEKATSVTYNVNMFNIIKSGTLLESMRLFREVHCQS